MISAFSLILIFFGIKVNNVHETILYGNTDQYGQLQQDPSSISIRSFSKRHLNVAAPPTTTTTTTTTIKPTKSPTIKIKKDIDSTNFESQTCEWYPPYDKMNSFVEFDEMYRNLNFDITKAIKYITKFSRKYCKTFEYGNIYNLERFRNNHDPNNEDEYLNIAIATVIILPTNKTKSIPTSEKERKNLDIFKDIRSYIFRLANAIKYAQYHGYTLIILTQPIFKYEYTSKDNKKVLKKKYQEWMKAPTFQKPALIEKFLPNFDWILWIDYDTVFLNCHNRAEDIINYALDKNPTKYDTISLIFGGERFATINAGVWLIKNNKWSMNFVENWIYIQKNAEKFQILKADDVHRDQPLFVALLQGFDVHRDINKKTYKDLRYHNNLAQKKYLTGKLKLNFEEMLLKPIWDEEIAKYAVPIDEAIINAKNGHFNKAAADKLDLHMQYMWVMHFYWKLKYRTKTVFNAFDYSLEYCR